MPSIVFSTRAERDLKKLFFTSPTSRKKLEKVLHFLLENPKHPSLRLHKLVGQSNWSVSLDYSLRLIFHYDKDKIFILRVGKHDEVYLEYES